MTLRYPPYVAGGYEVLTRDAVEGVRALGHDVIVLAGRGQDFDKHADVLPWLEPGLDGDVDPLQAALVAGNAERFRLHFFRGRNYRAAARAMREVRPDVVWFFNLGLVSMAPVLAARQAALPTLGYVADLWPRNHWVIGWRNNVEEGQATPLRLELLERAWRAFRDTMGLGPLCVCSDYMRRRLVDDGMAAADLQVVPPALHPEVVELARTSGPRPRAAGAPLRVVCTSSLWEGKGQNVLVEAVARARAEGASVELVLCGGGEAGYRARLEARANALDLGAALRFTGWIPREELTRELTAAHVLVMPSLWGEPFGLATIEGQAHGLAVVASDAGASPELVEDGVSGLLTPAGDDASLAAALLQLAADEDLRGALARRGQAQAVERYTRERFAGALEAALRAATGGGA